MINRNHTGKFSIANITVSVLILLIVVTVVFTVKLAVERYQAGVNSGVMLEAIPMEGMLEKEVVKRVQKMADAMDRAPQNARYDPKNDRIIPEVRGRQVDVYTTVRRVMEAEKGARVELAVINLEPEITTEIFKSIDQKVASFSTSGGGSAGRSDNLYVAAKYMNRTILAPGDVFSFNKVTGPRTFERGYSMAPIVGGTGIGGGVCQVATTVYNAALAADLEIIERYPHSIQVGYVRPGRDATVTDYLDFKFRNSTDKFIQIHSGAGGGHVWVQLWSQ
ncbi:VanW family protein [Dethiobacter alkaliphilus]|uniref:VanW family protein n=1 Tax=Dethiobacter alkaliphilus TaxID=427926 RepID=UPI00222613D3|nr:VanW family protein [Dethiobacter alkaliphilus]MCW3490829.1 VanW family protein [Dethiobacter alkaliphilus]